MRDDIFWIDGDALPGGRLAVSARPRGGDWLVDEVKAWRQAGVTHVVSLLTPSESDELDLAAESVACRDVGIEFTAAPVPDLGVPPSSSEFLRVAAELGDEMRRGGSVLIHCQQGIGRSSMMAASILADFGLDVETALQVIKGARGLPVPETPEQRAWLASALGTADAATGEARAASGRPQRR